MTLRRSRDKKTLELKPWTLWDELDQLDWRMVWVARFGNQQYSEMEDMGVPELGSWYEKIHELVMAEATRRALEQRWL